MDKYNRTIKDILNDLGLDHRYTDWIRMPEDTLYKTHDIIIKERKKRFFIFISIKEIEVARITSESPKINKPYKTRDNDLSLDGLKIRLEDNCSNEIENKIRNAALELEHILKEKVEVYSTIEL